MTYKNIITIKFCFDITKKKWKINSSNKKKINKKLEKLQFLSFELFKTLDDKKCTEIDNSMDRKESMKEREGEKLKLKRENDKKRKVKANKNENFVMKIKKKKVSFIGYTGNHQAINHKSYMGNGADRADCQ